MTFCPILLLLLIQISNFVVLSVIITPHNVSTPYIRKTHLPIVSLNVRELELNWCSKAVKEKNWVSLGSQNLDIWKSDRETGRGKLLAGVSGYCRENLQVWLTNTWQVIYQRDKWIKTWFLVWNFLEGSIFEKKQKTKDDIILQSRKRMSTSWSRTAVEWRITLLNWESVIYLWKVGIFL